MSMEPLSRRHKLNRPIMQTVDLSPRRIVCWFSVEVIGSKACGYSCAGGMFLIPRTESSKSSEPKNATMDKN